jgi:prepilin-type N-terminal cleavage/methylation domain-containing protein
MKARRARSSGFTLIELLVAISIFVVLGVLAYGG